MSRDWDEHHGRSMRDDDGGRSRGARFFVRSGDTRLGVICDPRDSTRACVDAALTMFDRIRQAAPPSPPSPPAGGTPTPR